MSNKAKLIGLLIGGVVGAYAAHASAPSIADELYSDSLYTENASAEIPSSLEASGRENQIADLNAAQIKGQMREEKAVESIADLDEVAAAPTKGKKVKSAKN